MSKPSLIKRGLLAAALFAATQLAHAGAIDKLRQFLDGTKTLRADFTQMVVAKNGKKPQISSGVMMFSRPGKFRWEVVKPYAQLLVGGDALEKNFTLAEAGTREGLDWVEAIPKSPDSGFEKLQLGFEGSELKGMQLQDNFGQTTSLAFSRIEHNPSIAATQFRFTPPAGVDVIGE